MEPYSLGDAFSLARLDEFGTHADAVARLREYLERHASVSAP
jgi:HAMP domain-containing protein